MYNSLDHKTALKKIIPITINAIPDSNDTISISICLKEFISVVEY